MPGFFCPGWDAVRLLIDREMKFPDWQPKGYRNSLHLRHLLNINILPWDIFKSQNPIVKIRTRTWNDLARTGQMKQLLIQWRIGEYPTVF